MYQGITLDVNAVMPAANDTGLLISLCTVQAPDETYGSTGAPSGTYANVVGLVDIPCKNSPISSSSVTSGEIKNPAYIASKAQRKIVLDGYYSLLGDGRNWGEIGWRAIVDGITYDILGAESDSQDTQTQLKVQLVTL